MGQAQSPEPQVGGSVGDAAKAVFNGVDSLVDKYVSKIELKQHKTNKVLLVLTSGLPS